MCQVPLLDGKHGDEGSMVAASFNPMTYVMRGLRALTMDGWDLTERGVALLAVGVVATLTFTAALVALKGRLR